MSEYIVRTGDTLSQIAARNNLSLNQLLDINPGYRTNPDHISAGQKVILPMVDGSSEKSSGAGTEKEKMPERQCIGDDSTDSSLGAGACETPLYDIVHVTGSNNQFLVLDDVATKELCEEIKIVDAWMKDMQTLTKETASAKTQKQKDAIAQRKMVTLEEGIEKGIVSPGKLPLEQDDQEPKKLSQNDIKAQVGGLQREYTAIRKHDPWFYEKNEWARNYEQVKEARLAMLQNELKRLEALQVEPVGDSKTTAHFFSNPYQFSNETNRSRVSSYKMSKQGVSIVEVTRASSPDKFHYVRAQFSDKVLGSNRIIRSSLSTKVRNMIRDDGGWSNATRKAISEGIVENIRNDMDKAAVEQVALKLFEAKTGENNALNAWHTELFNYSSGRDTNAEDRVFAVGLEAHSMRFAAASCVEASNFNPTTLSGALEGKANAAFSVFEAAATASVTLPDAAGFDCYISYENDNKEQIFHNFGAFRFVAKLELSCFAGARANASVKATVQLKPGQPEEPSGASALLSPGVKVSSTPGGNLALSGSAFAGAEAGGTITGALEWIHPEKQHSAESSSGWATMLDIKAGGALQFGGGLACSFQVGIVDNSIVLYLHGSVVFGPGGSGEFGATIEMQKIFDFWMVVIDILQDIDYRYAYCIAPDAYAMLYKGMYQLMVEVGENSIKSVFKTANKVERWWDLREEAQKEALKLASNINDGKVLWPMDKLLPEVLGPILYTLSQTWTEMDNRQKIAQEKAIIKILKPITSWRHFTESLQRFNVDGTKVGNSAEAKADALFDALEKLNSILGDQQQRDFNDWINLLQHRHPGDRIATASIEPFMPSTYTELAYKQEKVKQQTMLAWGRANADNQDQRIV